jgi:uncharacterized protein
MKSFLPVLILLVILYGLLCGYIYMIQERFIFFPEKLQESFTFHFEQAFEEKFIEMEDGTVLHGVLFRSDDPQGIVFYLHGNAGSLASWGYVAETYTSLNYDVFIPDYRGFGKSEGSLNGQKQLFQDMQALYNEIKKDYPEEQIVVLGYSIGTGPAAKIASTNNPRLLILQAPFYNLTDVMSRYYPFIPTFILKYRFPTNEYLPRCKMPVVIFHGDRDEVIDYGSSLKLKELFKPGDTLITLQGQGHNGMTDNADYRVVLRDILAP